MLVSKSGMSDLRRKAAIERLEDCAVAANVRFTVLHLSNATTCRPAALAAFGLLQNNHCCACKEMLAFEGKMLSGDFCPQSGRSLG